MSRGSSSGTLSSAAPDDRARRGRRDGGPLSEPLKARPIGERAAETMTASGMEELLVSSGYRRVRRTCRQPRTPLLARMRCVARHIYLCPLRWADMDSLGHVNNVTYVDYLQEARVDMLRVHAPDDAAASSSPRARSWSGTRWSSSPRWCSGSEPVRIESWVTGSGRRRSRWPTRSSTSSPTASAGSTPRARTVLTPYVFAEERPRRIRDEERAVLERFLEPRPGRRRSRSSPARLRLPRAVLRRRRLRARQQREVLRVLPGGADRASSCRSTSRWSTRRAVPDAPGGGPHRRRLQAADPVPARAVRRARPG